MAVLPSVAPVAEPLNVQGLLVVVMVRGYSANGPAPLASSRTHKAPVPQRRVDGVPGFYAVVLGPLSRLLSLAFPVLLWLGTAATPH
jgi:hypothetical protein